MLDPLRKLRQPQLQIQVAADMVGMVVPKPKLLAQIVMALQEHRDM
jgi:hypothetical protein